MRSVTRLKSRSVESGHDTVLCRCLPLGGFSNLYHDPGATKTFQWSPESEITAKNPRKSAPELDIGNTARPPSSIDLNAELARLTMFRGRTPQTTFAARKGSAVQLGPYRDGFLTLGKSAGKGHWETHPADELVHVLDGTVILDIVEEDRPQAYALGAGMMVVVPQGAWHRFHSADGVTTCSATIPGDHIDLDVDDPRTVERHAAKA